MVAQKKFMQQALFQAKQAAARDEVPVGAVVVADGKVIGAASNQTQQSNNPCAHAEILALMQAAAKLNNYRLNDCELYVTLEPCVMCLGAIFNARINKVYYAVTDEKTGSCGGAINLAADTKLNHHTECFAAEQLGKEASLWQHESKMLLQQFFHCKRQAVKEKPRQALPPHALRTVAEVFSAVLDEQFSYYTNELPALAGLRMHYLDSLTTTSRRRKPVPTLLALHPLSMWSCCFSELVRQAAAKSGPWRVLAPDFIGFGASDKYKKATAYSIDNQLLILQQLLAVHKVTKATVLLGDKEFRLLAAKLAGLPEIAGFIILPQSWLSTTQQRLTAAGLTALPFSDAGYRRGVQTWNKFLLNLVPQSVLESQQIYSDYQVIELTADINEVFTLTVDW